MDTSKQEYTDDPTGVRLIVESDNPGYPGIPKLALVCPTEVALSLEGINEAVARLMDMAEVPAQYRMPPLYSKVR